MKGSSSVAEGMKLLSQDEYVKVYDTGERVPCRDCGSAIPVKLTVMPCMGEMKAFTGKQDICDECSAKYSRQEEGRIHRERVMKLYDASGLGPRFMHTTFDNWNKRPELDKKSVQKLEVAFQVCRSYAKGFRDAKLLGQGLILMGGPGAGKTHMVAAIANELISQLTPVIFRPVPFMLKRIQATFKKNAIETEDMLMSQLTGCDLLILDDVGAEKWSEWVEATLFTIIDERYRQLLPVIITTNCDLNELEAGIGSRNFDRLIEVCRFVDVDVPSYRIAKATGKEVSS